MMADETAAAETAVAMGKGEVKAVRVAGWIRITRLMS